MNQGQSLEGQHEKKESRERGTIKGDTEEAAGREPEKDTITEAKGEESAQRMEMINRVRSNGQIKEGDRGTGL